MKWITLLTLAAVLASLALPAMAADAPAQKKLRHVVAFKFKETVTPAQIKEVEEAFRALKTKIPTIVEYEWGLNNSPENLNQGCTHGFIITFTAEKDRDGYLKHPAHDKFVELVKDRLEKVFVIDFWSQG